jgi:hypothetical protein
MDGTAGRGAGRRIEPTDLARVVTERLDVLAARGVTMGTVAANCRPPVSTSYLSRVASGIIRSAGPEKLAALAHGLGLPPEVLQAAASRPPRADPAVAPPLPCASAIAMHMAPHMDPDDLRRMDADFARQLQEYAGTIGRRPGRRDS